MAIKTTVASMIIGDKIICEYISISNTIGSFSNLGTSVATVIPTGGAVAPNGSFYYVYVGNDSKGRKILIADRNIQNSISWDVINTAGVSSGSGLPINFPILPPMTNFTVPSGYIVQASSTINATYDAWKAFNGTNKTPLDPGDSWHSTTAPSVGVPQWISIELPTSKVINSYTISPYSYSGETNRNAKDWTFEGWNGSSWVVLHTVTGQTGWAQYKNRRFSFSNLNPYIKYRLNATANDGGLYLAIGELILDDGFILYDLRILTGGTIGTDTDNEWDKYIRNSTLNGTIVAGADSMWNWSPSVYTWSSTVGSGGSRALRGYGSVSTWATAGVTSNYAGVDAGFRPVLVVQNGVTLVTKYLFQDNSDIKYYDTSWHIAGTAPVTSAMFTLNGMISLSGVDISLLTSNSPVLLTQIASASLTTMNLTAMPNDKLILASGDISITSAIKINSATLTATISGAGIVKTIVSVDSGVTWKAWYAGVWTTVTPDISDASAKGMTPVTINNLVAANWDALTGTGAAMTKNIRFGYFLSQNLNADVAIIDNLSINIDMSGTWDSTIHGTDYTYGYVRNDTIRVKLLSNGDFKINY